MTILTLNKKELEKRIGQIGTPVYVYFKKKIKENYRKISSAMAYKNSVIYFAAMANNNEEVLKEINNLGMGLQINSELELELAKKCGFESSRLSFTSIGISKELIKKIIQEGIEVNLDSVEEVKKFCNITKNKKFGIRVNIPKEIKINIQGATNVYLDSNVGIEKKDFDKVKDIAKESGNIINGVHGYFASNVLDEDSFILFGKYLAESASDFPDLEYINFGSGFGVAYSKNQIKMDIEKVFNNYSDIVSDMSEKIKRDVLLKIEPGRSILATAGILVAKVNNVKKLRNKFEISIDAGFGEFARPRIYKSFHEIENLEKLNGIIKNYDVRASTVLQDDFLGRDIKLEEVKEGDYLVIKDVGAYGCVMSSGFPGKNKPREIII